MAEKKTGLLSLSWVRDALAKPGVATVLDAASAEVTPSTAELPTDHLFTALLRSGLVKDMLCAFSDDTNTFWAFAELGQNVCGHPKTTHGGMTAALVDDTLGGLSFMLKEKRKKREQERRRRDQQEGVETNGGVGGGGDLDREDEGLVAPAGPAYTVQLDISYKKPVPAGSTVVVEATVESIEGRKMWLAARVLSGGTGGGGGGQGGKVDAAAATTTTTTAGTTTTAAGTTNTEAGTTTTEAAAIEHARARALFVVPRDWKPPSSDGDAEAGKEVDGPTPADPRTAVEGEAPPSPLDQQPRRAHSIEDDVLTEAGVERLALAAAAAAQEAAAGAREAGCGNKGCC